MPRNRTPSPNLLALGRLTDAAERAVALLDAATARTIDSSPEAAPEQMLVRHLDLRHLGRWVYLPGRPHSSSTEISNEPSVVAAGARLVGYRSGKITRSAGAPRATRFLVLEQGATVASLEVDVTDAVHVAPRDWS